MFVLMATITFDTETVSAKYRHHVAEAERWKRILDLLPELESASAELDDDGDQPSAGGKKGDGGALRPVNAELLAKAKEFVAEWPKAEFTTAEALPWFTLHKHGFNADAERDSVVLAFRHLVEGDAKLLTIAVKGTGRRVQVYRIVGRDSAKTEVAA
jgi:hypothetical protein